MQALVPPPEGRHAYYGWLATNRDLAALDLAAKSGRDELDPVDSHRFTLFTQAVFREWENAHYQFERGLFTPEEYEARFARWRAVVGFQGGVREAWMETRDGFAPSFRAEIDAIVAEVGG